MRKQWCSDAANQPQRCRIQRRAAECAQCRQQCSCVDLASGFVRISIAARKCTNANVRARNYCRRQPGAAPRVAEARDRQGSKAARAPQNQGREKGRQPGWDASRANVCSDRCLVAYLREPTKPARIFPPRPEAISILWRPVFPSGPLAETYANFSIALVIKIVTASRTRWCCAGIVDVRSSACTVYFERTLRRCARCCKNSATRAQLGPPNWISA